MTPLSFFINSADNLMGRDLLGNCRFDSIHHISDGDDVELQNVGVAVECIVQVGHGTAPERAPSANAIASESLTINAVYLSP